VPCASEQEIFAALGLPYREPADRELDSELMCLIQTVRRGGARRPLPKAAALKREAAEYVEVTDIDSESQDGATDVQGVVAID